MTAYNTWLDIYTKLGTYTGNVNRYDYRLYTSLNYTNLIAYLNASDTLNTFNIPLGSNWTPCNYTIQGSFATDFMQSNSTTLMPNLLNNMKVMIFQGQDDLYMTSPSVSQWINSLNWTQIQNFQASRRGAWYVAGNIAGYAQTYSNLTYVQVLAAGLNVGQFQPVALQDLAYRFIFNQGWN